MSLELFRQSGFWQFLLSVDQDLAAQARQQACACGGRLHCANYPRQPRGGTDPLPDGYRIRLSFCCDRDGCRKRVTPPSVRFLGRKVYLAAFVLLVTAMRQGPSARRLRELSRLLEIDRRTLVRWRVFWNELFPATPFWKLARGRFAPVPPNESLPRTLLEAFVHGDQDQPGWEKLLRFLAPISIAGGLKIEVVR